MSKRGHTHFFIPGCACGFQAPSPCGRSLKKCCGWPLLLCFSHGFLLYMLSFYHRIPINLAELNLETFCRPNVSNSSASSFVSPCTHLESAPEEGCQSVADHLKEQVRVLCWVMTQPKNHRTLAVDVKATWGRRCNILLFMSSEGDDLLPAVNLRTPEGRKHLWNKTRQAFKYVYEKYYHQAEWFLKADDDTYVVVENLRHMLKNQSASDPIWFGANFNKYTPEGYMSGGAGYVLSKEALRRLVEDGLEDPMRCPGLSGHGVEDVRMGECLYQLGVTAGDSRDDKLRWRFFPLDVVDTLISWVSYPEWFWEYVKYPFKAGPGCCSNTAISFHYVTPGMMYLMDYFLYGIRPYGIGCCHTAPSNGNGSIRNSRMSNVPLPSQRPEVASSSADG